VEPTPAAVGRDAKPGRRRRRAWMVEPMSAPGAVGRDAKPGRRRRRAWMVELMSAPGAVGRDANFRPTTHRGAPGEETG